MSVDSLMSRLNPLVNFILHSPVHWLLSPGLMLITVTGRRTGRQYTIPVGYQRDGDTVVVMVSRARSKSWWRNYRERSPIELRLRGANVRGWAQLVPPRSEEFRIHAERTLRRVPGMARVFKVAFDRRTGLSQAQQEELGHEIAVVRITLNED